MRLQSNHQYVLTFAIWRIIIEKLTAIAYRESEVDTRSIVAQFDHNNKTEGLYPSEQDECEGLSLRRSDNWLECYLTVALFQHLALQSIFSRGT